MILVTGAAGYIGSHFLRRYIAESPDNSLLAVDNLSTGHKESLPKDPRVVFEHCDVGDYPRIKELLQKHQIEAVVHYAANCYVGESEKDPFKYFNNNLGQTGKLLEAMVDSGVKQIVFSSTCATYGYPEILPLTEAHRQAPINVYGQTKYMVEQMLYTLNRTVDLSFVALRYFNAAGADESLEIGESHDPETHLIPNVLKALRGELACLEIFGDDYDTRDGTCIRDYVHVNDLASAHIAALKLMKQGKQSMAINLGTGHGASVKEIIQAACEVAGKEAPVKVMPRRDGDPPLLVADFAKAREVLGWTPEYGLRKIIESAWNWENNRRY